MREVSERLKVARRLGELPEMSAALRSGAVSWSGARELSRVATPDTEPAWLEAARGKNVRQVEKMVSGRTLGDLPDTPKTQEAERHVLRFEVDGATYASWREAVKKVRVEHGEELSEEQALLAIARIVLEGPKDAGRASYQVALTVCEECGGATQDGRGEAIAVSDEVRDMAYCDANFIGHVDAHVGEELERATQSIPPAKRRAVVARDHGQCVVDGCSAATFVDVHHLELRRDGGQHDLENMVLLCGAHHEATHVGTLHIEGTPRTGLRFFHADGSSYGSMRLDAEAAKRNTELFALLTTSYGLPPSEAYRAVLR